MVKQLCLLTGIMMSTMFLNAQDTLPEFSAINRGSNRIVISWTNPYRDTIRQLSIQRSYDSIKNFKSILTLPDPTVPQNGYVDMQAPSPQMYYRLYILLDNGRYMFSKAKRPATDLAVNTFDGLPVKPTINSALEGFKPSTFVFTDKYGNIKVSLPEALRKKYHIKFLEEDGRFLFELKEIKDTALILDKANFIHSGWFQFELYENGELKEKYRFFVPNDF